MDAFTAQQAGLTEAMQAKLGLGAPQPVEGMEGGDEAMDEAMDV